MSSRKNILLTSFLLAIINILSSAILVLGRESISSDHQVNVNTLLTQQEPKTGYKVEFTAEGSDLLPYDAKQAIVDAVQIWAEEPPPDNTFYLVGLRLEINWGIATLTFADLSNSRISNLNSESNIGEITRYNQIALLLVRDNSNWKAAIDIDQNLSELLEYVPLSELNQTARDAIFPSIFLIRQQNFFPQQVYNNYKFPFPPSRAWRRTRSGLGWHGSNGSSLDFAPVGGGNSEILAAAPGTVTLVCTVAGTVQTYLDIKTVGTNEVLRYVHLDRNSLTVQQGQFVSQGEVLGVMSTSYVASRDQLCVANSGWSSTHLHLDFPTKPFTIDGYTFSETHTYLNVDLYSTNIPTVTSWDFRNGAQGWWIGNGLASPTQEPNGMWYNVVGDDPFLVSPNINLSADKFDYLYLKMASQTDACGQIYFRRQEDAGFTDERYVSFSPVPDASTRYYTIDMNSHPLWTGNIVQLRLDPACFVTNGHAVRIDELALLANNTSWDFRKGSLGWSIGNGLGSQTQYLEGVWYDVTTNDPYLFGPMVNITAEDTDHLYLRMASQTDNCGQIFFRRTGDAEFADERRIDFTVQADGATRSYIIDTTSNPFWAGTIIQLRLDPACIRAGNHAVRIDDLSVLSNTVSWDFSNGTEGWSIGNGLGSSIQYPQGMWYDVTTNDPYLIGPTAFIPASDLPYIYVEMASQTDACGQIYFRRFGDVDFSDSRYLALNPIPDGSDRQYRIDLSTHPLWAGTIIQLRLDPACIRTGNHAVRVNRIILDPTLPAPNAAPSLNLFNDNTPTLTWSRVEWATNYQIEISRSSIFAGTPSFTETVGADELQVTTTTLADGTYYWHVRALGANGRIGGWSATDTFTINT